MLTAKEAIAMTNKGREIIASGDHPVVKKWEHDFNRIIKKATENGMSFAKIPWMMNDADYEIVSRYLRSLGYCVSRTRIVWTFTEEF